MCVRNIYLKSGRTGSSTCQRDDTGILDGAPAWEGIF